MRFRGSPTPRRAMAALALSALCAAAAGGPSPAQVEPKGTPGPREKAPDPGPPLRSFGDAQAPVTAGQVSGSVLTPGRQPVRGASVALLPAEEGTLYGSSTDEGGRYRLRDLPTGTYAVLVMDPGGYVLRKERVNVRPLFRNLVDFVTDPAGAPRPHIPSLPEGDAPAAMNLSGSLRTLEGEPISEAWVLLAPMGMEAPSARARTDAEGEFRLLGLRAGPYRMTARALGHVTWSLGPVFLEGGRDLAVRLTLLPFLLGQPENPEDLLVPVEPVPPEAFEKEP